MKRIKFYKSIFLGLLILGQTLTAWANVSLKNGNFFVGFVDIIYSGGFEPKIERVYNSKTPFKGIFGWGWGVEYETYLTPAPDGSVVVQEFGGGAENRFLPPNTQINRLNAGVSELVQASKKSGAIVTSVQVIEYEKKLRLDIEFRNREWKRFLQLKLVKPVQIVPGTQLVSHRFSYQYITKVKGGYVRSLDNGRTERFDEVGKLVQIDDKNSNFIKFTYSTNGRLTKIQDNFNRKIMITQNSKGLIDSIQGENGKLATYKYNDLDELVFSKDVDGNTYMYQYSTDRRHNMTDIVYSDRTKMQIAYYPKEQNENVKSIRDRDGTINEYDYQMNASKLYSKVGVKVKSKDGKLISQSTYEYFTKVKGAGEKYTEKMIAIIDGDRTETQYNTLGLPTLIKKGSSVTEFAYDARGRLTKKLTDIEKTELVYHPTLGKVSKVVQTSLLTKRAKPQWSSFDYDAKGNLEIAKSSTGKAVRLFYDRVGRIQTLVDQSKTRLDLRYNDHSRPIEITDPKAGKLVIVYNTAGEVQEINSPGGREIAMQVTSTFQSLLEILKPANVNLNL